MKKKLPVKIKSKPVKKLSIVDSLMKKLDKKGWKSAYKRNPLLEIKVEGYFKGTLIDMFEFDSKEFPGTTGAGCNLQDESGKLFTYFLNAQLRKKISVIPEGSEIFIYRQPDNVVVKKSKVKGKKSSEVTYRNYIVRYKSDTDIPF